MLLSNMFLSFIGQQGRYPSGTSLFRHLLPEVCRVVQHQNCKKPLFTCTRGALGFNKSVLWIPSQQSFNCTLDLLVLHHLNSQINTLTGPERSVMNEYNPSAFLSVIIHPLSSPALVGFFFVGKKAGFLHLCIDRSQWHHSKEPWLDSHELGGPWCAAWGQSFFQVQFLHCVPPGTVFTLCPHAYPWGHWVKTAFNTPSGHYEY